MKSHFAMPAFLLALLVAQGGLAVTAICPTSLSFTQLKSIAESIGDPNQKSIPRFEWRGIQYITSDAALIKSGLDGLSATFMNPYTVAFGENFQDKEGKKATISCSYAYVSGLLSWGWLKAGKPYVIKLTHYPELGTSLPNISEKEYQDAVALLKIPPVAGRTAMPHEIKQQRDKLAKPFEEIMASKEASKTDKDDAAQKLQEINDAYDSARFFAGKFLN